MKINFKKKLFILIVVQLFFIFNNLFCSPFPIGFCISKSKIINTIPIKMKDFATVIPGEPSTYIFNTESDYYNDYKNSYFAITKAKAGWDCMRHYEILANGCIPYFIDIDKCPKKTLFFLPKKLIKKAMEIEGVTCGKIDHTRFNCKKYYEILNELLEYTKKYLTAKRMAQYLLDTVNYSGDGKILYLSNEVIPDYLRECILIGLKELLQDRVIDYPKIDYLYKSYSGKVEKLYGKGFSYTKILEDVFIDRNNIEERIKNKEFDLIIYGSIHRGLLFYQTVLENYSAEKIVYICGEDIHNCQYRHLKNFFLREF